MKKYKTIEELYDAAVYTACRRFVKGGFTRGLFLENYYSYKDLVSYAKWANSKLLDVCDETRYNSHQILSYFTTSIYRFLIKDTVKLSTQNLENCAQGVRTARVLMVTNVEPEEEEESGDFFELIEDDKLTAALDLAVKKAVWSDVIIAIKALPERAQQDLNFLLKNDWRYSALAAFSKTSATASRARAYAAVRSLKIILSQKYPEINLLHDNFKCLSCKQ